ncbi:MAG: hypothetical protein ACI97B_005018, partial [Verrucomicrobiales bacterium]
RPGSVQKYIFNARMIGPLAINDPNRFFRQGNATGPGCLAGCGCLVVLNIQAWVPIAQTVYVLKPQASGLVMFQNTNEDDALCFQGHKRP